MSASDPVGRLQNKKNNESSVAGVGIAGSNTTLPPGSEHFTCQNNGFWVNRFDKRSRLSL